MSESLPGGPKVLTHDELDARVRSLHSVGGLYELIAACVEHDNRPFRVGGGSGRGEIRAEAGAPVES